MVTYARKPLKIDYEKSSLWALSSLGSVGAGPVGVQLFDLVNRMTHRAHRLELKTGGVSLGPPISGSFGSSDYENFRTPREVNFFDFDGTNMTVRETNVGLYSWTTVSFWGMSVRISGGGANIPGLSVSHGIAKILFSDGRPLGDVDLVLKQLPIPKEPEPFKEHAKEDALMYRIPGDILFAFNKYHLKPGSRTENALAGIGYSLHMTPEYRFLVIGHTDSIGSNEYNMTLSKRRAETVASWLKAHNFAQPAWLKAIGMGKSEPIASNATEEGRAQNRRVEVVGIRTKFWESYR
jgi:outer membrane protein OmpA-like peptidoglycan-associated protein